VYHDTMFDRIAKWTSRAVGHPATFAAAVLIIVVWAITGPVFGFSNTWQLVINTGTTNHHVPDGILDPEHANQGRHRLATEARRANPSGRRGAQRVPRSRGARRKT